MILLGGPSVQPLLRPDADGGELLRLGDGVRRGDPVHGAGAEGHVPALPVPQDAIASQLRHTCEVLGEKDAGTSSGLTKGETPRLRAIDQSLRQQRAFHHMGMMEQEAWRPQRGLPERSVNILRSWLFEHFLHPYVSAYFFFFGLSLHADRYRLISMTRSMHMHVLVVAS